MNNTAIAGNIVAMDEPCQSFPRIQKIRTELLLTPNSICLERPCLLKEFSKSKEGQISKKQHPFVRRAKALAYIFSNRQSHIYQDELIIGNMTSKRIAGNYYPEGGSINILEDLFKLEKRQTPLFSLRAALYAAPGAKTLSHGVKSRRLHLSSTSVLDAGLVLINVRSRPYLIRGTEMRINVYRASPVLKGVHPLPLFVLEICGQLSLLLMNRNLNFLFI